MPEEISELKKENTELRKQVSELCSKIRALEKRNESQKRGMIKKSSLGHHISRPPFGYKWDYQDSKLIPAENFREVEEIFEEFLQPDTNLTKLSEKHNLSINGLKKILKNFTYLGKVKFDGQIHQGNHQQIVSSTLFNKAQDKLEKIRKRK